MFQELCHSKPNETGYLTICDDILQTVLDARATSHRCTSTHQRGRSNSSHRRRCTPPSATLRCHHGALVAGPTVPPRRLLTGHRKVTERHPIECLSRQINVGPRCGLVRSQSFFRLLPQTVTAFLTVYFSGGTSQIEKLPNATPVIAMSMPCYIWTQPSILSMHRARIRVLQVRWHL